MKEIFKKVLDCSFAVHTALGPGLLESVYEECLYFELQSRCLHVEKQKALPVIYKGIRMDSGYRIDLIVENTIIVEIKAVETVMDVHYAQILTYMKLSGCKLGLLVNFNVAHLKDGIKRMIF